MCAKYISRLEEFAVCNQHAIGFSRRPIQGSATMLEPHHRTLQVGSKGVTLFCYMSRKNLVQTRHSS